MKKGFVDIQVNGWMGTDFMEPGLTVEQIREVTCQLASRGTIAYCPTIMTAPQDVYEQNLRTFAKAMAQPDIAGHILGIHLEGPFISPKPGALGMHRKDCVREPSTGMFDRFQEWAEGNVKILTVAPEQPGCEPLIRHASESGVVVSMGHHLATDQDMERAVNAGASLCTHLGNGMPNEIPRHDNPLWWQLACDEISGLFITDGHHLPADFIKVALRAKTAERFIATSDAAPLAGMPPGKYVIRGNLPVVIDEKGKMFSEKTGSLACSHSTMIECMDHLASLGLLSEEELWQVAFFNPLKALGRTPEDLASLNGPEVLFEERQFRLRN